MEPTSQCLAGRMSFTPTNELLYWAGPRARATSLSWSSLSLSPCSHPVLWTQPGKLGQNRKGTPLFAADTQDANRAAHPTEMPCTRAMLGRQGGHVFRTQALFSCHSHGQTLGKRQTFSLHYSQLTHNSKCTVQWSQYIHKSRSHYS